MKFSQYPYDLYVLRTGAGGVDENGFPTAGEDEWVLHCKARESGKSKPDIVATVGGLVTNYSSVIVMPVDTAEIAVNSQIKLQDGEKVIIAGNVLRFTQKQLHCRLWV